MTWIVAFVALVCGAVIQSIGPGPAFLGQVKWPVLSSIVIYYALVREVEVMLVVAFCAGFLQDVLSPIPLGYSSFCFVLAGAAISGFKKLVLTDSVMTMILAGGLTGFVLSLVMYVLLFRAGMLACSTGEVVSKIAGGTVLGLIVTPIVYKLTGALDSRMGNVELKGDIDDVD